MSVHMEILRDIVSLFISNTGEPEAVLEEVGIPEVPGVLIDGLVAMLGQLGHELGPVGVDDRDYHLVSVEHSDVRVSRQTNIGCVFTHTGEFYL